MLVYEQMSHDDLKFYDEVEFKHNLSLEEKDELLFALMEYMNLRVLRAQYDPTVTVLTIKM